MDGECRALQAASTGFAHGIRTLPGRVLTPRMTSVAPKCPTLLCVRLPFLLSSTADAADAGAVTDAGDATKALPRSPYILLCVPRFSAVLPR